MMKNCFVREEDGRLVLCSGLGESLLGPGRRAAIGPVYLGGGSITVAVERSAETAAIEVDGRWPGDPPPVEIRLPGFERASLSGGSGTVTVKRVQ
jgi:hypothetical protein